MTDKPVIYTLGHSTLAWDDFAALLKTYGIEALVDIRSIPRSRHNPQFNDTAIAEGLSAEGISYIPMKALGGRRHPHKLSCNTGWHNEAFRGYADYMQTPEFEEALNSLVALSRKKSTAIMCAEAVPWRCHRSLVADALVVREIPVIEILSKTSSRQHRLTPFAHAKGTCLTYPEKQEEH